MTFDLNSIINGRIETKPRILLYAMPKVGKTTFASHFPNHIIINVDGSAERIDCCQTPRITNINDFLGVLESLYRQEHFYKTIVIDTLNWLEKLICDEVVANYNYNSGKQNNITTVEEVPYGQGYPAVVRRWRVIIEKLEKLRLDKSLTILMLAHAGVRKHQPVFGDSYDIYSPRLYGKTEKENTSLDLMIEFSDIILFAHNKVLTKQSTDGMSTKNKPIQSNTILYTTAGNACYIAGNRYGLTPELPFTYDAFVEDMKRARKEQNQQQKTIEENKNV